MKGIASFAGNSTYVGGLTDGIKPTYLEDNGGEWFAFYYQPSYPENINAPDGIGTMFIDLGEEKLLTDIKLLTFLNSKWGINAPAKVEVFSSNTGADDDWMLEGEPVYEEGDAEGRWGIVTINRQARYVKVVVTLNGTFAFFGEVELYGADVPAAGEQPETVNFLEGVTYTNEGGTKYSYGDAETDGTELTDGYIVTDENMFDPAYKDDNWGFYSGLANSTVTFDFDIEGNYMLSEIIIDAAAVKAGSGITQAGTVTVYYKNADGEWVQFAETFVSTETDDTTDETKVSRIVFTVDGVVEITDLKIEASPRSGKAFVVFSEVQALGYAL